MNLLRGAVGYSAVPVQDEADLEDLHGPDFSSPFDFKAPSDLFGGDRTADFSSAFKFRFDYRLATFSGAAEKLAICGLGRRTMWLVSLASRRGLTPRTGSWASDSGRSTSFGKTLVPRLSQFLSHGFSSHGYCVLVGAVGQSLFETGVILFCYLLMLITLPFSLIFCIRVSESWSLRWWW